jgi:hypothetical protein
MAELTDTIYDLISQSPEQRMRVPDVTKVICAADETLHGGDVRRALRMLADANRIMMEEGGTVTTNWEVS